MSDQETTAARRFLPLILGGVATIALFVLYLAVGGSGWPGAPDVCLKGGMDTCWCEAVGPATDMVRQPHNTWSNLGFVLSGLGILLWVGFDRAEGAEPSHTNPMSTGSGLAVLYGAIAVYMGWSSFFFHGSMSQYGGYLDSLSLYAFTAFLLAYNVMRIWSWGEGGFHALFWSIFGVFALVNLALVLNVVDHVSTVLVGVLGVGAGVFEIWSYVSKKLTRNYIGIVFFYVSFVTAAVLWVLSATGKPLCEPDGAWQGHAIWHGLTAICTFLFFLYARTEDHEDDAGA